MTNTKITSLLSVLKNSVAIANSQFENQQIKIIDQYFNKDGTPKTQSLVIKDKTINVPLMCLAIHKPLLIKEMKLDFSAQISDIQDNTDELMLNFNSLSKNKDKINISITFDTKSNNEAIMRVNDALIIEYLDV